MKVNQIKQTAFTGSNIIDMHWHEGTWKAENAIYTEKDTFELVGKPIEININGNTQKDNVKYIFVSNLDCMSFDDNNQPLKGEIIGNLEMLDECQKHSQKKPYAVCQVGYGNAQNIEKLIKEHPNSFIGLKFHPMVFKLDANSEQYYPYMKIAEKYNLPCLFHSDKTGSYACPKKIYELAQKFPKVPVILAHMGAGTDHTDAIEVLLNSIETGKANLYGDTSWIDCKNNEMPTIMNLIKRLKQTSKGDQTHKLLFGSDAPVGEFGAPSKKISGFYNDTVSALKTMIFKNFADDAETISDNICCNNSEQLFLNNKNKLTENLTSNNKYRKNIPALIITGMIILAGITTSMIYVIKNKPNNTTNLKNQNQFELTAPQIKFIA